MKIKLKMPCKDCITFPICNSIYCDIVNELKYLTEEVKISIFLSRMYHKCQLLKFFLLNGEPQGHIESERMDDICDFYNKENNLLCKEEIEIVDPYQKTPHSECKGC